MGWKLLKIRIAYKNPWIRVEENRIVFPNGKKGLYGVVSMADTVAVLAKEGQSIYLVRQYRYTTKKYSWELPSGHINKGETPLKAAKRELREEAGLEAKQWTSLGFVHPALGVMNSKRHIFLAQKLSKTEASHEGSEKGMIVKKVALQDVKNMVRRNVIFDDYTIAALYKLNL